METIEERATKYACDGCMPDGIECDVVTIFTVNAREMLI